ncbi:MAG: LptA/OstA family protein [Kiritimatiellia bacterium]
MKTRLNIVAAVIAFVLPMAVSAVGLSDLAVSATANPDDVMLRRPAPKAVAVKDVDAEKKAAEAARAKAAAEKVAAEKAEAERKAAEAARAKAAAEKAAAEKAEAERKAAEAARAKAVAEKAAAEKAAADAEMKRLREQVQKEKAAREKAEAAKAVAEAKVEEEQKVAAEAVEKAARAEKRADYLANPDPDERPAPKKLVVADAGADVTEGGAVGGAQEPLATKKAKKELTGRSAVITADRTDYDRKEGVILFDRNVFVDDEQYQMHAERLFVFLDGTNEMKRLVALGNVSITNEDKAAWCAKAVYTKAASRIVMYGDEQNPAWLRDAGGRQGDGSEVRGLRITYWIDSGLATVEKSVITVPGLKGSNNPKDLFNPMGAKKKAKKDE